MRWLALIAALLLAGPLAGPARAQGDVDRLTTQIVDDIVNGDGQLDPCAYTTDELQAVLGDLPSDVRQYQSDIKAAIRAAITARARGDCDSADGPGAAGSGAAAPTPSPAATPTPPPPGSTPVPTKTVIPEPPGPDAQLAAAPPAPPVDAGPIGRPGNDAPTPLLLLGILAALGVVGAVVVKGGGRVGVAEGPLAPVRHAWREAAWRFGGWGESFRDWVRLGR